MLDRAWMTDWKESLTQRKEQQAEAAQAHSSLHARFLAWHNGLPEVSRVRPFSMIEIEQALNTQGKYLSPILLSEGWQRKRKWNSKGQYHRYWVQSVSVDEFSSVVRQAQSNPPQVYSAHRRD